MYNLAKGGHGYGTLVVLAVYIIAGNYGTFLREHPDGKCAVFHLRSRSFKVEQHGLRRREAYLSNIRHGLKSLSQTRTMTHLKMKILETKDVEDTLTTTEEHLHPTGLA